jgi:hypothetical protein
MLPCSSLVHVQRVSLCVSRVNIRWLRFASIDKRKTRCARLRVQGVARDGENRSALCGTEITVRISRGGGLRWHKES